MAPIPADPDLLPDDSPDRWTTREILAARPARNAVDPRVPYAYLVEDEPTADGQLESVATVFLTNRECPFRCLMCDLWKNTTSESVPPGAVPEQIAYALERLPRAPHLKLYNSGNFFDGGAILVEDRPAIARLCDPFRTVIVENHPRLCGPACRQFADQLEGRLEIALGLETVHPDILPRLNKQMTLDDFRRSADRLLNDGISLRAFVLLRPPWLDEAEGVEWAIRSIEFAFDCGVGCVAVIPMRSGNGAIERLAAAGAFAPPQAQSLEQVLRSGLAMNRGRVLADLWDFSRLAACETCRPLQRQRIEQMNWTQQVGLEVACCCHAKTDQT